MRRVVFIDGSNFYFKLKQLTASAADSDRGKQFDFRKFAAWLAARNELSGVRYYIGAVRREPNNDKSLKLYSDQQRLIGRLQTQKVDVVLGHLIRHPDRTYHESVSRPVETASSSACTESSSTSTSASRAARPGSRPSTKSCSTTMSSATYPATTPGRGMNGRTPQAFIDDIRKKETPQPKLTQNAA